MTKIAKLFFIYTLYFVLAIAAYVLFYLHIENKSVNASEIAGQIATIQNQNAQMQNLDNIISETREGREKLSSYFIDSNEIIEFLETIEGLGDLASVDIDVNSINEEKTDNEKIKSLNLSIDFEGEWVNVHHFLVLLENMPIQMTTKRLNIREVGSIDEEDGGTITWDGSIEFKTLQIEN